MSERYVTLVGAEQVQGAANQMRAAADEMMRAASSIDSALHAHRQFLDEWLLRFQQIIEHKP